MDIEKQIKNNVPLAPLTTFRIGGPAKYFLKAKDGRELIEALKWAQKEKLRFFLLAGGSNILISDNGYDGLVIRLENKSLDLKGERIEAESGGELSRIVSLSASNNLGGLEWGVGIPGTIGGAVIGNAGAFGRSISESIETVEAYNIKKDRIETFSRRECGFSYKHSIFKEKKYWLVLKVSLKLKTDSSSVIKDNLNKYSEYRNNSQPKLPSAGCIFKNLDSAVINEGNALLLSSLKEKQIHWQDKLGAGALIDLAGVKGKRMGGAKVSLEHANFIINVGNAKANEVVMLISYIKQQVRDKFGIQLCEEIEYVGF